MRYAIEKLVNSATAALYERDELQKRLKIDANRQKRAKEASEGPHHKIPAEGLQSANYAELRAHFSARHPEDLANSNKIKCIQAKVERLEGKIRELFSKLNN